MSFGSLFDYALAAAQCVLALLLWHQAEPRMREARGPLQAACVLSLGFVLALSFPMAYQRAYDAIDNLDWQRTVRDAVLLLHGLCFYVRAMRLKPFAEAQPPRRRRAPRSGPRA